MKIYLTESDIISIVKKCVNESIVTYYDSLSNGAQDILSTILPNADYDNLENMSYKELYFIYDKLCNEEFELKRNIMKIGDNWKIGFKDTMKTDEYKFVEYLIKAILASKEKSVEYTYLGYANGWGEKEYDLQKKLDSMVENNLAIKNTFAYKAYGYVVLDENGNPQHVYTYNIDSSG